MWFGEPKVRPYVIGEEDVHVVLGHRTSHILRDAASGRGSLSQALLAVQNVARRKCRACVDVEHLLIALLEFEGAFNPLNPERNLDHHVLNKDNDVHSFFRRHEIDPAVVLKMVDDASEMGESQTAGELLPLSGQLEVILESAWVIAGSAEPDIVHVLYAMLETPDVVDILSRKVPTAELSAYLAARIQS